MPPLRLEFESLKAILDNLQNPEQLDSHPWVDLSFVQEAAVRNPSLREAAPGKRLVSAVESLFYETMPSAPPRRSKRLDNHWGEFGLMAAQYFAPIRFGTPYPASLRDAWGRIDKSITLYVLGPDSENSAEGQAATYQLVGGELEVAPNSTLSDWHRKGIEKLLETIRARERYLEDHPLTSEAEKAPVTAGPDEGPKRSVGKRLDPKQRRKLALVLVALFLLGALVLVVKARRAYDLGTRLLGETAQLRDLAAGGTSIENMRTLGPVLSQYRKDYLALKREATPFIWMGPLFGWVPKYGGDLAAAGNLVALSDSMLAAADISYQAMSPLLDVMDQTQNSSGFDPERFTEIFKEAQPKMLEAQKEMDRAVEARSRINLDRLSPQVREIMTKYVDRVLPWMQDGVTVAVELPRLMGATNEGPKTYLLLAQNEDELRPTGGFITAAGTMLVQNGKINDLNFVDSSAMDEWTMVYPSAPWQLRQYMGSPVLVLRDSNWFTDFPTTALYAESLYAYRYDHSVDGIVTIDQHVLVEMLRVMEPVEVEGAGEPIGANNVVDFMRAAKVPPGGPSNPGGVNWNPKAFINKLTAALLQKIVSGNFKWDQLSTLLIKMLDERHILAQMDDPAITAMLARRGWDGAIRPQDGDFLMVSEFNTGFNKTNAVVDRRLSYDVDLSNMDAPISRLSIWHKNNSADIPCIPFSMDFVGLGLEQYHESDYPIDRCYWAYIRVYTPNGTELLQANPQTIPANWMIYYQEVPPQVDLLDEEIPGVNIFGFLKVTPSGGGEVQTDLRYALPTGVVTRLPRSNVWSYKLHVQKQPGTVATPFNFHIHLPSGAAMQSMPSGATRKEDGSIVISTDLREDRDWNFLFTLP